MNGLANIDLSRMSPMALHRLDPKRFARPLPAADEVAGLNAKVSRMREQVRVLSAENDRLTRHVATLEARLAAPAPLPSFTPTRMVRIADVIDAFCKKMKAEGYVINGVPYGPELLVSKLRSRNYVLPRHVCIWLIRAACPRSSVLAISETLKLDHTSILHALKRAPEWMSADPFWERIANEVLDHFRGVQP